MPRVPSLLLLALAGLSGCPGADAPDMATTARLPPDLWLVADLSIVADLSVNAADLSVNAADLSVNAADLAQLQNGGRIAAGDFVIDGVTDDDYLLVHDAIDFRAIRGIDGNATIVAAAGLHTGGKVVHKVAFVLSNVDRTAPCALNAWSAAGGPKPLSQSMLSNSATAAADGSYVAWREQKAMNDGLLLSNKPDGSAPRTLAAKIVDQQCGEQIGFVNQRVVHTLCAGQNGVVTAYDPATGNSALLANNVLGMWVADPTGHWLAMKPPPNNGQFFPAALISLDGKPVQNFGSNVNSARFRPDGLSIFYVDRQQILLRHDILPNTDFSFGYNPIDALWDLSADGKWLAMIANNNLANTTTFTIASAEKPGVQTQRLTDPSFGNPGLSFTADSAFVVYSTGFNLLKQAGTLTAAPTTGGLPLVIRSNVVRWWNPGGARLVWTTNRMGNAPFPANATADVEFADLAKGAAVTRLVSQVRESDIAVGADGKTLYYGIEKDGVHRLVLP